jgi:hypothetical protein
MRLEIPVFSVRHNSACRTRACLLCPRPVSICKFRNYLFEKIGFGIPSEIGNTKKDETEGKIVTLKIGGKKG